MGETESKKLGRVDSLRLILPNSYNGDHGHSNLGDPTRESAVINLIPVLAYTVTQLRVNMPMQISVCIRSLFMKSLREDMKDPAQPHLAGNNVTPAQLPGYGCSRDWFLFSISR